MNPHNAASQIGADSISASNAAAAASGLSASCDPTSQPVSDFSPVEAAGDSTNSTNSTDSNHSILLQSSTSSKKSANSLNLSVAGDTKAAPKPLLSPEEQIKDWRVSRFAMLFWRLHVPASVLLTFALVSPFPEPVKEMIGYTLLLGVLLAVTMHFFEAVGAAARAG